VRSRFQPGIVLALFWLAPWAYAQTIIPHPPPGPRYIVISTRRLSTFKTELTLTVMQGYQVVAVAPKSGTLLTAGQTVLLERLPEGAPAPQYWLADDEHASLDSQLNSGAWAGFRLIPNSAFQRTTHDFWGDLFSSAIFGEKHVNHQRFDNTHSYALMEKRNDAVMPCRYRVTTLSQPQKHQLYAPGLEAGYRIAGDVGAWVIMESCAAATPGENLSLPEHAGANTTDRFRVLVLGNRERDRKHLNDEVSHGYRVLAANGPILTLEKAVPPASPREHKFFFAKNDAALEKQLSSDPGFRFVSVSMVEVPGFWGSRQMFAVMEKSGEAVLRYEYLTLSDTTDTGLQDKINEATKQGYEARGLARCANRLCAILERPAAPDQAITPK
jgi:hypothetical protein